MTTTDVPLQLLDRVRVASPCHMKWEDMDGDGPVRHCGECDLNVYNFSDMTAEEVEAVLRSKGERLCAGFYRRSDGTVMTRDCPVGLAAVKRHAARTMRRIAAGLAVLLAGGTALGVAERSGARKLRSVQPFRSLCTWLAPAKAPVVTPNWIAGEIALPAGPGAGAMPAPGAACISTNDGSGQG